MARTLSLLRYPGSKAKFVRWIVAHLAQLPHELYVEPYFGSGAVFFAKPPSTIEVVNDIDGDLVCLFRVIQHPRRCAALARRLMWTPYSSAEFHRALEVSSNASDIDRAWATMVRCCMGYGGRANTIGDWSRCKKHKAHNVDQWLRRCGMLEFWHQRLRYAQIDQRDALQMIRYWDGDKTLFYLDPPYHPGTRRQKIYRYEYDAKDHEQLIHILLGIRGKCVLSGYDHPLYDKLVGAGWKKIGKVVRESLSKVRARRHEFLWVKDW